MKETYRKKVNRLNIITGIGLVGAILIAVSIIWFGNDEAASDYVKIVQEYRQEKDKEFRTGEDSPIEDKSKFDGLSYFYPNKIYKVEAKLQKIKDSIPVTVLRSDGKQENYLKYAIATFELEEREHRVILLKKADEETDFVFLPFSDLTAGRETYSGGRYLDLQIRDEETATIDFNFAYNPYCLYNYRYSCPLPPKENFIDAEIRAGEKMYRE